MNTAEVRYLATFNLALPSLFEDAGITIMNMHDLRSSACCVPSFFIVKAKFMVKAFFIICPSHHLSGFNLSLERTYGETHPLFPLRITLFSHHAVHYTFQNLEFRT
jgi:hypothetical protein